VASRAKGNTFFVVIVFFSSRIAFFVRMDNLSLYAESGGTKTDWVLLQNNMAVWTKTSGSLHYRRLDAALWKSELISLKLPVALDKIDFHFFGAGFAGVGRQKELSLLLAEFPFKSYEIKGDIHILESLFSAEVKSWVAILGTGSVLLEMERGRIHRIHGGKGFELGDEGGGAHFGRLVLQKQKKGSLSNHLSTLLKGSGLDLTSFTIENCLSIEKFMRDYPEESAEMHLHNWRNFYQEYIYPVVPKQSSIHFVGGTALHQRVMISNELSQEGYKLGRFIHKPLEELVKTINK
jgi:glucosamine kinase